MDRFTCAKRVAAGKKVAQREPVAAHSGANARMSFEELAHPHAGGLDGIVRTRTLEYKVPAPSQPRTPAAPRCSARAQMVIVVPDIGAVQLRQ